MWTYVLAFTPDLFRFMMVRSRKRGGWEMPGGGGKKGETPVETSRREFLEETGYSLLTDEKWSTPLGNGVVHFGTIGEGDPSARRTEEIAEIGLFSRLPDDLAYPSVEYEPLIEMGREMLADDT